MQKKLLTMAVAGALAGPGLALAQMSGTEVYGTVNAAFAVTRTLSLEFMIGVVVLGIIWYVGAFVLNRNRGIDLGLAYREIPPE